MSGAVEKQHVLHTGRQAIACSHVRLYRSREVSRCGSRTRRRRRATNASAPSRCFSGDTTAGAAATCAAMIAPPNEPPSPRGLAMEIYHRSPPPAAPTPPNTTPKPLAGGGNVPPPLPCPLPLLSLLLLSTICSVCAPTASFTLHHFKAATPVRRCCPTTTTFSATSLTVFRSLCWTTPRTRGARRHKRRA